MRDDLTSIALWSDVFDEKSSEVINVNDSTVLENRAVTTYNGAINNYVSVPLMLQISKNIVSQKHEKEDFKLFALIFGVVHSVCRF